MHDAGLRTEETSPTQGAGLGGRALCTHHSLPGQAVLGKLVIHIRRQLVWPAAGSVHQRRPFQEPDGAAAEGHTATAGEDALSAGRRNTHAVTTCMHTAAEPRSLY